ncbi:MAG TPA: TRAP transporter small permease subunit [Caulobacteraceae bacterium]|nr:TRAP transporter small permease subunit [Caulobacteraceae bacterium]
MPPPPAWALRLTRLIDGFSRWFGTISIWLVLLCALISAANAIIRYSSGALLWLEVRTGWGVFGGLSTLYANNSNALSDTSWYMFAAIVMLGAAWTLKNNAHVRVDLLYGAVSERTRTWIDLLGGLFFLMPLCVLLIYFTWGWAWTSVVIQEASANAGGLPQWPAKILLPIGFFILLLQAIAEIIKCILALTTTYVREFAYEKPVQ